MKCWLAMFLMTLSVICMPAVASATEADLPVSIIKKTSCDVRAPRVALEIKAGAERVGYGRPDSDTIYWLDTDGAEQGTHKYTLARQRFGSTRQWVMVVAYKGDQGLTTARALTFARPTKAACAVTQVVQLSTYRLSVNKPCFEGSLSMYIVAVRVKPGTPGYIVDAGTGTLIQKNGKRLNSVGGYVVPDVDREADFYVYAGRFSKLQLDASGNTAHVITSSPTVELVESVSRTCQPDGEGQV